MTDSSVLKLVSQTVVDTKLTGPSQAKASPSKFDQVRARLDQPSAAHDLSIAQNSPRVSPQEKKWLEAQFKKRLEEVRQRDLHEIFRADLRESKERVDAIRRRVSAQPASPALEPVKARLLQVESQYLESGRLLRGLGKLDSPADYLKMQLQMYQLTQNVELLSKIAGEVVGGVNKVLSTQV